ncbi:MAG: ribosome maturation factor RimP [Candidatus Hydrogenedens sp.]|nr:ribosome maturation factor RimP [Candidatus Hydrogenedens sp.]
MAAMGGRMVLRLYIDREGGVNIDDCVAATRLLNPLLDETELFDVRYMLEVSSPGFDRPLRKPEHFAAYVGERVKVQTHMPVLGRKRFTGVLKGFTDGMVVVACDGQETSIHLEQIKKANLDR